MASEGEATRTSAGERQRSAEQERQARAAREQMLRVIFSSEARERLNTVRMVKPDIVEAIETQMIQLAASGRLKKQVSDEELKQLLSTFQRPRKEFKINWK